MNHNSFGRACREAALEPVRDGFDAQRVRFPLAQTRQPGDTEFVMIADTSL